MKIGVLALQGAFIEHVSALRGLGADAVEIRLPPQLDDVDGLIIPGGESTTMRRLIDRWELREPILTLIDRGAPVLGTCAGMIVLAKEIAGGDPPVLPVIDVTVERNAFGRQLDSFETELDVPVLGSQPVHAVFIRAPVITRVGPGVAVMATLDDGRVVAVRERNVLATSFHPELAGEARFARHLVPSRACGRGALPSPADHDGGRARGSGRGGRASSAPHAALGAGAVGRWRRARARCARPA